MLRFGLPDWHITDQMIGASVGVRTHRARDAARYSVATMRGVCRLHLGRSAGAPNSRFQLRTHSAARRFVSCPANAPAFFRSNGGGCRRAPFIVRGTVNSDSEGKEVDGARQVASVGTDANNVVETRKTNVGGEVECVGTALEVECILPETSPDAGTDLSEGNSKAVETEASLVSQVSDLLLLISPFFFWGTSMAVMKIVAPHTSPLFVGAVRLLPAGIVLVLWAVLSGRPQPKSTMAWTAVALFGLIDGACFQGCLAEGLQRTSAGLGSVIIDSQPITVAILANIFYDEALSSTIVAGMGLGILGLGLLEVPPQLLMGGPEALAGLMSGSDAQLQMGSIWDSGEWWMLLAAQSMAIGTVMVRWVTKYCDPVSATGWHMVIGSFPLIALCLTRESDVLFPRLADFTGVDALSLLYVTLLGSAASYGVFFYNASKGNLTSLSSLTFLTPVFATVTGYLVLGESLTSLQLGGAAITLLGVFCINK